MPGKYGRKPENRDPQFAKFSDQRLKANGWTQAQIDAVVYKMDAETMGRYGHSEKDIKNYVQDTHEYKLTGTKGKRDGYSGQEGVWDKTAGPNEQAPTATEIRRHNEEVAEGQKLQLGTSLQPAGRANRNAADPSERPVTPREVIDHKKNVDIGIRTGTGTAADLPSRARRNAPEASGRPVTPQEIQQTPSHTGIPSAQDQKNREVHAERTRVANEARLANQGKLNTQRQAQARAANKREENRVAAGGFPSGFSKWPQKRKQEYVQHLRNRGTGSLRQGG